MPEVSNDLEPHPMCKIKHKDALSAMKRATTAKCKAEIARITCLSESQKLYYNNITRLCPIERSHGRPAHSVGYGHEYGSPIRIVYILSVHGRALRQLKRLFKAIYHSHHYFYFHVDSVSWRHNFYISFIFIYFSGSVWFLVNILFELCLNLMYLG